VGTRKLESGVSIYELMSKVGSVGEIKGGEIEESKLEALVSRKLPQESPDNLGADHLSSFLSFIDTYDRKPDSLSWTDLSTFFVRLVVAANSSGSRNEADVLTLSPSEYSAKFASLAAAGISAQNAVDLAIILGDFALENGPAPRVERVDWSQFELEPRGEDGLQRLSFHLQMKKKAKNPIAPSGAVEMLLLSAPGNGRSSTSFDSGRFAYFNNGFSISNVEFGKPNNYLTLEFENRKGEIVASGRFPLESLKNLKPWKKVDLNAIDGATTSTAGVNERAQLQGLAVAPTRPVATQQFRINVNVNDPKQVIQNYQFTTRGQGRDAQVSNSNYPVLGSSEDKPGIYDVSVVGLDLHNRPVTNQLTMHLLVSKPSVKIKSLTISPAHPEAGERFTVTANAKDPRELVKTYRFTTRGQGRDAQVSNSNYPVLGSSEDNPGIYDISVVGLDEAGNVVTNEQKVAVPVSAPASKPK